MECVINELAIWKVNSNKHNIQVLYMFTKPVYFSFQMVQLSLFRAIL